MTAAVFLVAALVGAVTGHTGPAGMLVGLAVLLAIGAAVHARIDHGEDGNEEGDAPWRRLKERRPILAGIVMLIVPVLLIVLVLAFRGGGILRSF